MAGVKVGETSNFLSNCALLLSSVIFKEQAQVRIPVTCEFRLSIM